MIGRAARRNERRPRVVKVVGEDVAEAALDVLEITELAWHDCYGEPTPPDGVIDDIFVVSRGTLEGLARAARLAVVDQRDLRLAAAEIETARSTGRTPDEREDHDRHGTNPNP